MSFFFIFQKNFISQHTLRKSLEFSLLFLASKKYKGGNFLKCLLFNYYLTIIIKYENLREIIHLKEMNVLQIMQNHYNLLIRY